MSAAYRDLKRNLHGTFRDNFSINFAAKRERKRLGAPNAQSMERFRLAESKRMPPIASRSAKHSVNGAIPARREQTYGSRNGAPWSWALLPPELNLKPAPGRGRNARAAPPWPRAAPALGEVDGWSSLTKPRGLPPGVEFRGLRWLNPKRLDFGWQSRLGRRGVGKRMPQRANAQ